MTRPALLNVRRAHIDAPGGRPLFRDLSLSLATGERAAIVGRNGVGKSTLLDALAERVAVSSGRIWYGGRRAHVPQLLPADGHGGGSPGQRRLAAIERALATDPDLLLLDEPTDDLDEASARAVKTRLTAFKGALLVVSHDPRLLDAFRDFLIASEKGCRHFRGTFDELLRDLARERDTEEQRYVRHLSRLADAERRDDVVRRRRERKKNRGRIAELGRCPSRALLNGKRSYAQESQGKRAVLQRERAEARRHWAQAARRALAVDLPLEATLPDLPAPVDVPIAAFEGVSAMRGGRPVFENLHVQISRERVGIVGPNGSGKSTLVEILVGARFPDHGTARVDPARLGYVAQSATNWMLDDSLGELLSPPGRESTADVVAQLLRAHHFPLALAMRPLRTLSPGERLRAALICLCSRAPAPELLVLDEPTDHLDLLGTSALGVFLAKWPGGFVVVSHDRSFLERVGVQRTIELGDPGVIRT